MSSERPEPAGEHATGLLTGGGRELLTQDVKDHIKTKRHFGSESGARDFLNLRRIIKNFINPHQGLKGLTPAEAAGVDLHLGRQRLYNLILAEGKKKHHSLR